MRKLPNTSVFKNKETILGENFNFKELKNSQKRTSDHGENMPIFNLEKSSDQNVPSLKFNRPDISEEKPVTPKNVDRRLDRKIARKRGTLGSRKEIKGGNVGEEVTVDKGGENQPPKH